MRDHQAPDDGRSDAARYDPFSPAVLVDPFPAYAALRAECPVHRFEGFDPPFYPITRHADVVGMLRDWETWSSHYGQSPRHTVTGCLFSDPPAQSLNLGSLACAVQSLDGNQAPWTGIGHHLLRSQALGARTRLLTRSA